MLFLYGKKPEHYIEMSNTINTELMPAKNLSNTFNKYNGNFLSLTY
jgi:hypothetical protein